MKALIVIDPDRCSMVAENRTTLRTGPPSVLAAMARHPLLCLHRGSPRLGAGGIGTLDRALWLSLYALLVCSPYMLSLYVYVWSDPGARGTQPSGLTLPVDSRHKTGTGEVAEWLKAALC